MQHIGQGAIPRLVTVTEYIAPTSRELQDWVVETEVHTIIASDCSERGWPSCLNGQIFPFYLLHFHRVVLT